MNTNIPAHNEECRSLLVHVFTSPVTGGIPVIRVVGKAVDEIRSHWKKDIESLVGLELVASPSSNINDVTAVRVKADALNIVHEADPR